MIARVLARVDSLRNLWLRAKLEIKIYREIIDLYYLLIYLSSLLDL